VQRPPCSRLRGRCQLAAWHRTDRPATDMSFNHERSKRQRIHVCTDRYCVSPV
jgi:hypothetical protein